MATPTTAIISMSWSKKTTIQLVALLSVGWLVDTADAAPVCPVRGGTSLRYVDVFDGPPEDLAILVPDENKKLFGSWQLAYIYKAGRFVTIRCKYADGQAADVKLPNKVEKCDYKIDVGKILSVSCK
jgi:hypothetical protein